MCSECLVRLEDDMHSNAIQGDRRPKGLWGESRYKLVVGVVKNVCRNFDRLDISILESTGKGIGEEQCGFRLDGSSSDQIRETYD